MLKFRTVENDTIDAAFAAADDLAFFLKKRFATDRADLLPLFGVGKFGRIFHKMSQSNIIEELTPVLQVSSTGGCAVVSA
jgi:hypothetical protein